MIAAAKGPNRIAHNAHNAAYRADIQLVAIQIIPLLNVVFQIAAKPGGVALGSGHILQIPTIALQIFFKVRGACIRHARYAPAAKGAAERAGFLQIKAEHLHRVAQHGFAFAKAANHFHAADHPQHAVKHTAADHSVQMRADDNGFSILVAAGKIPVQVSHSIHIRLHS